VFNVVSLQLFCCSTLEALLVSSQDSQRPSLMVIASPWLLLAVRLSQSDSAAFIGAILSNAT
jgi:hypothetical protein